MGCSKSLKNSLTLATLATLTDAAAALGLDRKSARVAAAHALADGIAAWRAGTSALEELLEEASTPGGTATAVIASLDDAGYGSIIARGLRAGIRHAHKNASGGASPSGVVRKP